MACHTLVIPQCDVHRDRNSTPNDNLLKHILKILANTRCRILCITCVQQRHGGITDSVYSIRLRQNCCTWRSFYALVRPSDSRPVRVKILLEQSVVAENYYLRPICIHWTTETSPDHLH